MNANGLRKFSVLRVFGSVGAIGLVVSVIFLGGSPGIFINFPWVLFVGGLTGAMLVGLYGMEASYFCHDAFRVFFFLEVPPNPRYAAIARSGSRFAMAAGAIGSLIGIIQMLTTLDDPSKIGGGTAVSLSSALYGLILSEFVFGFLITAYSPVENGGLGDATIPMRNLGIPIAVIGFIVLTFVTVVLAFNVMKIDDMQKVIEWISTPFNPHDLPVDPTGANLP